MLRLVTDTKAPDAFIKAEALHRLPVFRRFLILETVLYFVWWIFIEWTGQYFYNPMWSRAIVSGTAFAIFLASYRSPFVAFHIDKLFYASLYLLFAENSLANYMNFKDASWPVATYVTVVASCACILSRRALFGYSIYVFCMATIVSYLHDFLHVFYLPGIGTILIVANLALSYQYRTVRALAEVTERFEQIFHATFEGICIHERGQMLDVNRPFASMFGYSREELIGMDITQLVAKQSLPIVHDRIQDFDSSSYEAWGLRKDGSEFPVEVAAKEHSYEGRMVRFITVRDTSERMQAELDREKRIEAQAAVRLRDQFISIASHELKTPLTPLKLSNDILLEVVNEGRLSEFPQDELKHYLLTNDSQLLRINKLIESMLDVSRISSGNFALNLEEFDLIDAAKGTMAAFTEEAKKTRSTLKLFSKQSIPVCWDQLRIEQVLCNLIKNALTYAPGKVITLSLRETSSHVVARVKDTGPGISEFDLKRIFERFERAVSARHFGGLGLGLYIAEQIVKAHQGRIRVRSKIGRGTSFTIVLPRRPKNATVVFSRN